MSQKKVEIYKLKNVEKKSLTRLHNFVILFKQHLERCPSGLRSRSWKPVTPKGAVGSNPTFSAYVWMFCIYTIEKLFQHGEVPKWLKGLPWKGSRSLVAARGFKSLLLRFFLSVEKWRKKLKKLLTKLERFDRIYKRCESGASKTWTLIIE